MYFSLINVFVTSGGFMTTSEYAKLSLLKDLFLYVNNNRSIPRFVSLALSLLSITLAINPNFPVKIVQSMNNIHSVLYSEPKDKSDWSKINKLLDGNTFDC